MAIWPSPRDCLGLHPNCQGSYPRGLPLSAPQLSGVIAQGSTSVYTPIIGYFITNIQLLDPSVNYLHFSVFSQWKMATLADNKTMWFHLAHSFVSWKPQLYIYIYIFFFQFENLIYQHFLPLTFLIFSQVFIYLVWVPRTELMLSLVARAFTHWAVFVVPVASPSLPCKPLLSPSFSLLFSSWDKVLRCSLDSLYRLVPRAWPPASCLSGRLRWRRSWLGLQMSLRIKQLYCNLP